MKIDKLLILIAGFLMVMGLLAFVLAASSYLPIVSFNGGRISPHMEARNDFPKYNASCRTLDNFLITAQGPVTKRPGTKYIDTAGVPE